MKNIENVMESLYSLKLGEIARCFLFYNRNQEVLYTYNTEDNDDPDIKTDQDTVYIGELYSEYTEEDIHRMAEEALMERDYLDYLASTFAEEKSDEKSNIATNVVFAIRYDREIGGLSEVNCPQYMEMNTRSGEFIYTAFSDVKKYMSEENTVVFVADIPNGGINEGVLKTIRNVKNLYITPKQDTYPVPTAIMGIMFLMEDEEVVRLPLKALCSL